MSVRQGWPNGQPRWSFLLSSDLFLLYARHQSKPPLGIYTLSQCGLTTPSNTGCVNVISGYCTLTSGAMLLLPYYWTAAARLLAKPNVFLSITSWKTLMFNRYWLCLFVTSRTVWMFFFAARCLLVCLLHYSVIAVHPPLSQSIRLCSLLCMGYLISSVASGWLFPIINNWY